MAIGESRSEGDSDGKRDNAPRGEARSEQGETAAPAGSRGRAVIVYSQNDLGGAWLAIASVSGRTRSSPAAKPSASTPFAWA